MSLFNLKNKSILITGSSKGIGKAIAYQCAQHGAKVIISSRKLDICEQTADEINTKLFTELTLANLQRLKVEIKLFLIAELLKTHFFPI